MYKLILYIRATLFWIGYASSCLLVGLLSPFLLPFSYETNYRILLPWTHFNIWWLKLTCGVKYKIIGRENIDKNRNGIIMANHRSTWESLFIPSIFPPLSWVLKQEMLKIPFLGWAVARIKPIAIDRSAVKSALNQVKIKGKARLDDGNWVCIFPEGTRVKPGDEPRAYRKGGALLAYYCAKNGADYPIYTVAHNSGELWPKHSFIKYPGIITVVIGQPFSVKGLKPNEINEKVKQWIEKEVEQLPPARNKGSS